MGKGSPGRSRVVIGTILVTVAVGLMMYRQFYPRTPATQPSPVTQPTTAPATAPVPVVEQPAPVRRFIDLARTIDPNIPATQPLAGSLNLEEAAHLVIHEPVYLDSRLDLWITRDDADNTLSLLRHAADEQVHFVRDRIAFVHWAIDSTGHWAAHLVCHKADGGYELVDSSGRQDLANTRHYRWDRAVSWNGFVIVPGKSGVEAMTMPADGPGQWHDMGGSGDVQMVSDGRGLLAWMPGGAAARFTGEKWVDLGQQYNCPAKVIQIVPMIDGSLLVIAEGEEGTVQLALLMIDPPPLDEKPILELIERLADVDPDVRQAAFEKLSQYGSQLWPILEKHIDNQPPEAQLRMRRLLKTKLTPTIAGMAPIDARLRLVARTPDAGAVYHATTGISVLRADGEEQVIPAAFLSIRPDTGIRVLPEQLMRDFDPDKQRLLAVANEWLVRDPVLGLRRFFGNELVGLLADSEREFDVPVGIDRAGRWLFRRSDKPAGPTLVIDRVAPVRL